MELLGSGGFGSVYKAKRDSDGKIIALKIIDIPKNKPNLVRLVKNEIQHLKLLSVPECNPFVICYYDSHFNEDKSKVYIEMELVEGKDMSKFIVELRSKNTLGTVYYYLLLIAKDIAEGLKYIHSKGIVHNDIKPQNIVIDNNFIPRIVDVGVSCFMLIPGYCKGKSGTARYFAPEYFLENKRFPASDMWALGVTLYLEVTKSYPYNFPSGSTVKDVFKIIKTEDPKKINTSNQQLNNVVNGLLTKDRTKRLTAQGVIDMLEVIPKPKIEPVKPIESVEFIEVVKPVRTVPADERSADEFGYIISKEELIKPVKTEIGGLTTRSISDMSIFRTIIDTLLY